MNFENPSTFSLRPATEDDLPSVLAIERKAYSFPWSEEAMRGELLKPFAQFLVLTDDESDSIVAGYIVYWLMFEECHVLNVTVNPEWRGLGHGKLLVRKAIDEALRRNMQRVFLEVRKSNDGAIALYQKIGFFIDHVKKGFYDDGEDAYFMILYLSQPNKF